ncbi:hypothetical protein FMEXI_897 [Fusarium mexicanum]|uniref:Reverse transcriptase domain-containing protein n=1 Tax=Fusarium mexicanum TaxID=751941 RepID=A0A8H5JK13_9HYPO|nr:hypothetical protein FMEXI_897 [Fusarium mexicanum]
MQATNQEDSMIDDTMIEDLEYMNIDGEFNQFEDDNISGGEIREDETLLKEITIWSVNLKGAPIRIRHLETALRLAPENERPLVLAIQDPPNRLAFHNIPGYNIFFSSDHPITEEQYPTWRNGASATGTNATTNATTNAATNVATSDGTSGVTNPPNGTDPPAITAEPLMHSVCFYVHKSIPTTSWGAIMDTGDNNGLVATLQILTADRILTIHNVYDRNNRLDLDALFERIDDTTGDAVLVGDFNLHHRSWSSHTRNETAKSRELYERVSSSNMQLLTIPGTITYSNSQDESVRSSTIDLTFANQNIVPDVVYCRIHSAQGFRSDHRIIETKITRLIKTKVRTRPCLDRVNPNTFKTKLKDHLPPMDEPLSTQERIISYLSKIIQALRETIRSVAPMIEIGLQRKRQTILEKQLNDRVSKVTALQERDKRELWRIFTEVEPPSIRKTFHLASLGQKICRPVESSQLPTMIHSGMEDADTPVKKVSMFKEVIFRANKGPKSCRAPVSADFTGRGEEMHIRQTLTDEELEEIIKGLPRWKSTGPDEVPYEAIQLGGDELRPHLLRAFQVCLHMSYHPANFKDAILVMVRKSGKPANMPTSWRPLALLSCLGKILEKIVASRMQEALKANPHLLPARQFGWRTTSEALEYMLDKVYSAWAQGKVVTIMGLDISGAYDNVWRQALIQTLADKGFPRWIVNMIQSFLSDRTASFRLPGIISDQFDLNTGVPQGSPLSPILFLFFAAPLLQRAKTFSEHPVELNGKRSKVNLSAFAFVDDIYLMAISDSYEANCKGLEMLHESVMTTADELDLRFGAGKYKIMHFKKRQSKKGHNNVIPNIPDFHEEPAPEMKILGVIVSSDLTWGEHISMIIRKVKQRMGYLSFISGSHWGPNLMTMRLFFISKIRPVFTYACGAWFIRRERDDKDKISYQINNKQIKRLEDAYTFCLRKISGAFYRTAPQILEKEIFVENIWTVLHSQATLQRAKLLFPPRPLWRSDKTLEFLKSGVRNPYDDLNLDAFACIINLFQSINFDENAERRKKGLNALDDPKARNIRLRSFIKVRATRSCWVRWEKYTLHRRFERARTSRGDNSAQLPAALTERWGKQSLSYYDKNMSRAQTTILLHCRTEFIGLKAHLSKIGIKEAGCGRCACEEFRETPFHLFVQCERLKDARKKLEDIVGHTTYQHLVTKHSKVATQWALKYFDIEQFDSVRSKHTDFDLIPEGEALGVEAVITAVIKAGITLTLRGIRRIALLGRRDGVVDCAFRLFVPSLSPRDAWRSLWYTPSTTTPPLPYHRTVAWCILHSLYRGWLPPRWWAPLLPPGMLSYTMSIQLPGEVGSSTAMRWRLGSSLWQFEVNRWSDCAFEALLEAELSHCVKPEVYFLTL